MSETEFRSGLVICKYCSQFWSSLGETSTVTSTVCKRWPSWIPECRVMLSKHGVWPACCSLASMHRSFPASDTPWKNKMSRAPWGQYFRFVVMLTPHSQECSTYPIVSDIIAVTIYAPAVRKENERKSFSPSSSYWTVLGFGDSKAIKFNVPLSCVLSQSHLHSSHSSSSLFSFYVIICLPLVSFCFPVWNKIKGKVQNSLICCLAYL